MKKMGVIFAVALLIGLLYQVLILSTVYGPNLSRIRSNLGKSALWRGANFNQSQKVADYIEFLNRNIPENARVIIPSFEGDNKVLVNPYMQFFLAPREVINCVNIECLQSISRDETYIIIAGNLSGNVFPDASPIMFDDDWGLLPPENHATERILRDGSFNSLGEIIRAGVVPLVWVAGLTLAGTAVVSVLFPVREWLLRIALGYGLGLGLFTIWLSVFDLIGFQLNAALILVIYGTLLGVALISLYWGKRKYKPINSLRESGLPKEKFDILPLVFVGIGIIVIILTVGKGYHRIDAIQIWGAKGYGIAADNSLGTVTDWGTNTLPYPLHIPVLIAAFRILFGDVLPSSKLIFGGYYLAAMMIGYHSLLGMGVRRWFSALAVFLLFTTPIIFRHGIYGYANLPLTFYLLSGVVVFLPVFRDRASLGNLFLSGLFLACAAWTRPEGLLLSFFGAGLLLLLVLQSKNISLEWQKVFSYLAPLVIYFLFWQVIKLQIYQKEIFESNLTSDALADILRGEYHFKEVFIIFTFLLQELITPKVWGALGLILLFAIIFLLIFNKYISQIAKVMIATGGLFLVMILGMYYLTSYDTVHDLGWWLTSGLDRMVFPGLVVLWLGIVAAIHDQLEGSK